MPQSTDPRIDAFLAEARRDPEAMLITVLEYLATTRRQFAALAEVNRAQAATIAALTKRRLQVIQPGLLTQDECSATVLETQRRREG